MNNVWIDLTDLFAWKGHFTGIQRVTYNYAQRFADEGARFFIYSKLDHRFVEIPFSLVRQRREESPKQPQLTTAQQLKSHYKKLPRFVRALSSPLLNTGHRAARRTASLILGHGGRTGFLGGLPEASFAKNDTIILLDAAWNVKGLVKTLTQKKQELDLNIVVHLNDILPVYQQHLFTEDLCKIFAEYTYDTLKIASLVTVISEATKRDIVKYCSENKLKQPPVEVVRLGEDINTATPAKPNRKLDDKFIFCFGTFEIRKNYILLYQAVKLAQQEGRELPQIVVAGRRGWLTHDLQYILDHDKSISDKFILLEDMSDANISWLLDHCMFTVFCSLAEGWGLPIAESLQHGKFCLSSNTSSMPEIAGDLIDYFSPYDPKGCYQTILRYTENDAYIKKEKEIKATYKPFTWDASYESYKSKVVVVASANN